MPDSSIPTPPGSTTIGVDDLSAFTAPGWAVAPGNQYFLYTGKSAATGPGTLTGIPAAGYGAITAPIRAGTIRMIPFLTGIPAGGAGAVTVPIKAGDEVAIRYEETDAAAAHAMAVRLNIAPLNDADGIFEAVISDGRFGLTELIANVRSVLTDRKDPLQILTFETRDESAIVGSTVTIALTTPLIAGTFRIQTVTLSEIGIAGRVRPAYPPPLRRVTATNKLYSFADLVRRWRLSTTLGGVQ